MGWLGVVARFIWYLPRMILAILIALFLVLLAVIDPLLPPYGRCNSDDS